MSGLPVLLEGDALAALVVGGGAVASRKVRALIAAGARVRVVAATIETDLHELAEREPRLTLAERRFEDADLQGATLVVAATDERATNARIGRLAREQGRLVSVSDAPSEGSFSGMAVHRAGDVVIGVSAGGVPSAATRIRDAIAERFDERYATAIAAIRAARRRLLNTGSAAEWRRAMPGLIDDRFCSRVESGALVAEADAWR